MVVNETIIDLSKRNEELAKAAKPLLDFIYKYGCPYSYVIVTESGAELLNAECAVPFVLRD